MKKIVALLLVAIVLLSMVVLALANEVKTKLIIDDVVLDVPIYIEEGRMLVPLRKLMESKGAEVKWYGETRDIDVIYKGITLSLRVDEYGCTKNNITQILDVPPRIYDGGTTYLPVRAVMEAFGFTVDWDDATKTALVHEPGANPYVDIYNGITVEESRANKEEFEALTGLSYEKYRNELLVVAENAIPLSKVAEGSGITMEELKWVLGLEGEISPSMTIGEAKGEMTFGDYLTTFSPLSDYNYTKEECLEVYKSVYGLGDEYTVNTKYKFVRTIVDSFDVNEAKKDKNAWDEAVANLPNLTENKVYFTIEFTNGKKIKGELYPDLAPITVKNFINLSESGHYDGTIFHRVIEGFMIQGGAYTKDFHFKEETPQIKGEFMNNGVSNGLSHEAGVISMARAADYNSATHQFFIVTADATYLDKDYAAFGRITEGMDFAIEISRGETTTLGPAEDVPVKPYEIKTIKIGK